MIKLTYQQEDVQLIANYFVSENKNAPLIIEIHGGAMCFGDENSDVLLCEKLLNKTGFNVVSLGYRLAPKYPFPNGLNDVCNLYDKLVQDSNLTFDRNKIIVMGHSAGANLAMGLVQSRNNIYKLILDYPWIDLYDEKRKYVLYGIPKFVFKDWMNKYCSNKNERKSPLVSPIYISDEKLSLFPKTLLIACEEDTLKQDAKRLNDRFMKINKPIIYIEYKKARHGFIETCSSGRNVKNFYTSSKAVKNQGICYDIAIKDILKFLEE